MAKKEKRKAASSVKPKISKKSIVTSLLLPILILGFVSIVGMIESYSAFNSFQKSGNKIARDGIYMVNLTSEINKELEVIQKQVLVYCVSSDEDAKATSLDKINTTFGYLNENVTYVGENISDYGADAEATYAEVVKLVDEYNTTIQQILDVAKDGVSSVEIVS